MPTSSIFASVIDEDPEAIKNIADVLEEAEKRGPSEMTTEHPVMPQKMSTNFSMEQKQSHGRTTIVSPYDKRETNTERLPLLFVSTHDSDIRSHPATQT